MLNYRRVPPYFRKPPNVWNMDRHPRTCLGTLGDHFLSQSGEHKSSWNKHLYLWSWTPKMGSWKLVVYHSSPEMWTFWGGQVFAGLTHEYSEYDVANVFGAGLESGCSPWSSMTGPPMNRSKTEAWGSIHYSFPWLIHGAAIYGAPWIPSIYPLYVSIYTSTMDPMGLYVTYLLGGSSHLVSGL